MLIALALLGCDGFPTLPIFREERTYRHTFEECIPGPIGGFICQIDMILDETGGATLWGDDIPHCGKYGIARDTMTVRIGEETVWRFAIKDDGQRMTHVENGTEWLRIESDRTSSCRLEEQANY